ncbi:hypothetical protein F4824DRAFT_454980 [Ustulina deusta]|nr:hypothetical protein F4824DRAFT_454980 [Ustulina deusta]
MYLHWLGLAAVVLRSVRLLTAYSFGQTHQPVPPRFASILLAGIIDRVLVNTPLRRTRYSRVGFPPNLFTLPLDGFSISYDCH